MKILALDQSTRVTGWAIMEDHQLISFGHIAYEDDNIIKRIVKLCKYIEDLIATYQPTKIILENIQMQAGNVDTFQKLAWVQGAIQYMLAAKYSQPFKLVYPTEWRAKCDFLKGKDKGRASQKKVAQEWVKQQFNQKCTQDEADAICIAWSQVLEQDNIINFE